MIIGGAYQGKLAYAKETFPDVRWTDGEQCEKEAIFQYKGILAKQLKEKNPDLILVTDEIGYGIVPMDPFLREVRETTGRICTELAKDAKSVIRVVCGIPTVIKAQVK